MTEGAIEWTQHTVCHRGLGISDQQLTCLPPALCWVGVRGAQDPQSSKPGNAEPPSP